MSTEEVWLAIWLLRPPMEAMFMMLCVPNLFPWHVVFFLGSCHLVVPRCSSLHVCASCRAGIAVSIYVR